MDIFGDNAACAPCEEQKNADPSASETLPPGFDFEPKEQFAAPLHDKECWVTTQGQAAWPEEVIASSATQQNSTTALVVLDDKRCSCASSHTPSHKVQGISWTHTFGFTTCTSLCKQCGGCISCRRFTDRGDCWSMCLWAWATFVRLVSACCCSAVGNRTELPSIENVPTILPRGGRTCSR